MLLELKLCKSKSFQFLYGMNLLFDFLKYIKEPYRKKIEEIKLRGVMNEVWHLLLVQAEKDAYSRDKIEQELGISSSHFDKISSVLLSKCYQHLFANNILELLSFLSLRSAFVKNYYAELNRQIKVAECSLDKSELANFYIANINFIHFNMPIIYKDKRVLKKLASKFLAIKKDANSKLLISCKLMYIHIDTLFANGTIKSKEQEIRKKMDAWGGLPDNADEELTFAYYWLQLYFDNALENFANCMQLAKEAVLKLKKFSSKINDIQLLRVELKISEMLYYHGQFDESFRNFEMWMKNENAKALPDYNFYSTKYLQICLITGHLDQAKEIIAKMGDLQSDRVKQVLLPRDCISVAKYYLFSAQYEQAFTFIQLGFDKNPKGKYFQYEIELRNLQTAYFYLTNQQKLALQISTKHIKYLRSHGCGIRESNFPHFYVLVKAFCNKKALSDKELEMMHRYQLGSYALYGRLLLLMQAAGKKFNSL